MIHELYFVIRYERELERIHHVDAPETTIGRIQTSVLCLPDPVVSRNHAVLIQTPTEFVIRDLRSRNGTLLNGQPIVEAVLSASSVVEIGPYQLKVFGDRHSAMLDAGDSEGSTREQPFPVLSRHDREEREKQLTPAQRRVYDAFLQGRSEKEIARSLRISTNTVHTHARAIYTAFDVSSRAELLSLYAGHLTLHDFHA